MSLIFSMLIIPFYFYFKHILNLKFLKLFLEIIYRYYLDIKNYNKMKNFAFCILSEVFKIEKWLFFNVSLSNDIKTVVKAKFLLYKKRIFDIIYSIGRK